MYMLYHRKSIHILKRHFTWNVMVKEKLEVEGKIFHEKILNFMQCELFCPLLLLTPPFKTKQHI